MAYRRSRWESKDGRFRIEKKYYSYRAMPLRPEIKEKRAKRQNVTKETQAAVNCRLRAEKLSRLLVDNFRTGDWYLTCTYREKPDADEVQRDFEKFKRKVRSIYKKAGVEARYISVLENLTGAGRPHGHILLPALDAKDLEKVQAAWPHGSVAIKLYGGHLADADRLARYFTKEKVVAHAGRLQTSRNLLRREPKVVTVTRAEAFQTDQLIITGMYRFNYMRVEQMLYAAVREERRKKRYAPAGGKNPTAQQALQNMDRLSYEGRYKTELEDWARVVDEVRKLLSGTTAERVYIRKFFRRQGYHRICRELFISKNTYYEAVRQIRAVALACACQMGLMRVF